jgi:hypothetical protein
MKNLPLMYFEAKPPKLGRDSLARDTVLGSGAEGYILDLVEDNAARLVDSEETNDGGENCHTERDLVVGNRKEEDIIVVDTLGCVIVGLACPGSGVQMVLLGAGRRWPRRLRLRAN